VILSEWVDLPTPEEQLTLGAAGLRICPVCGITRGADAFDAKTPNDRPLCPPCRTHEGRAAWAALTEDLLAEGKKYCAGPCHAPRGLDEFYTSPARADGRSSFCAECISRIRLEERRARAAEWRSSGRDRLAYVYRLYDDSGALLYIGKTYDVGVRLYWGPTSHALTKDWFPQVSRVVVQTFSSDADALAAEAHAIHTEAPRHNVVRPRLHALREAPQPLAEISGEVV
jgi:hypothetical protein